MPSMTKQIPTFSASIAVALAMCLGCGGDKAAEPSSDGSKAAAKAIRSALPAEIGHLELNISLYLQPDGTGSKTHNKFLQLKEGTLHLDAADEEGVKLREKHAVTDGELKTLNTYVLAQLGKTGGDGIDYPKVEVEVELGPHKVGFEYAIGKVPAEHLAFQTTFFKTAFE